jgi:hypothetical protein
MVHNKFSSIGNVLSFAFFLGMITNVLPVYSQPKTPTPEDIVKAIKAFSKESVDSNAIFIKQPSLAYEKVNKETELQYYLGNIDLVKLNIDSGDPYIVPFRFQLQIESLRQFFNKNFPDEVFWKTVLQSAEGLILDTVRDIENTNDKEFLQRKLDAREEQFGKLILELHQGIKASAQKKGFTARRVGGRDIASDSYIVQIIKKPPDARILILPIVKYVQCNSLRKCGNDWPWRELVSESENLIGEYYYRAEWQDGRKSEGRIDIRNNTSITFVPK